MNSVILIGAVSTPPTMSTFGQQNTPKLSFMVAAAYTAHDGAARNWRHPVEVIGDPAEAASKLVTQGGLVLVHGSLTVREFTDRKDPAIKRTASEVKGLNIQPVSPNLVGVTRRDDGSFVADETVINEIMVAGPLAAAPYSNTTENHPLALLSINAPDQRRKTPHIDNIKAKTWDPEVAAQFDGGFEGMMVMVRGMLLNEFHQDEATGVTSGGPYIRIKEGAKL